LGKFCLSGADPLPCPSGTYFPFNGCSALSACLPCASGWACPFSGMSVLTVPCAAGYYCPSGTSSATQFACPSGTYSDASNLVQLSGCSQCPEGYTCGSASTSSALVTCTAGHYCPLGTSLGTDVPCLPGSYSNVTGLSKASSCTPCPVGFWCQGGKTFVRCVMCACMLNIESSHTRQY
jgi:hypothetical protein